MTPPRRGPGARRSRLALAAGVSLLAVSGCELTEVTATRAEDRVVVEGLVRVGLPRPDNAAVADPRGDHVWASVFLHRTVQGEEGANEAVPGARVELRVPGGQRVRLVETRLEDCVASTPARGIGTCYIARVLEQDAGAGGLSAVAPGVRVDLEVETGRGERLTSTTLVPGDLALTGIDSRARCVLPPDTPAPVAWAPSQGAWAYVAETEISGLGPALAPEGIFVEDDPLALVGLAVGTDDTDIVFPNEFGIFDRFDLDRDLAVRLQRGLPDETGARISVNAVDRNYVNWIRGGNFNPSGQVRIPSVQGDGTGFFGSAVTRWFDVVVSSLPGAGVALPACPLGAPDGDGPAG